MVPPGFNSDSAQRADVASSSHGRLILMDGLLGRRLHSPGLFRLFLLRFHLVYPDGFDPDLAISSGDGAGGGEAVAAGVWAFLRNC